jgi:hypothetical protein
MGADAVEDVDGDGGDAGGVVSLEGGPCALVLRDALGAEVGQELLERVNHGVLVNGLRTRRCAPDGSVGRGDWREPRGGAARPGVGALDPADRETDGNSTGEGAQK